MPVATGLLAASLFLSAAVPAEAFTAKYTTTEAVAKYNQYIDDYQNDEVKKVALWRQDYSNIKGSLAAQLVERAIWYMDQGYMVYGHQYKGYKDYGIVDCSNFVSLVYSDFGFDITTTAKQFGSVGKKVSGVSSVKVGNYWTIKGTENLLPGDIFTYWAKDSSGNKYISHVAIYMGQINGQPAVIGTAGKGNPTAIGIVSDVRYWWGENLYSVQRVLPERSWTAGKVPSGHEAKAPVIPKQYQLPPQKPVQMPGEASQPATPAPPPTTTPPPATTPTTPDQNNTGRVYAKPGDKLQLVSSAYMRSQPSLSASKVALLSKDTTVTVISQENNPDWYIYVENAQGQRGYVSNSPNYVKILPPPTPPAVEQPKSDRVYAKPGDQLLVVNNAYIRSQPSLSATKVALLAKGSTVKVISQTNNPDWYIYVENSKGQRGYVSNSPSYVKLQK